MFTHFTCSKSRTFLNLHLYLVCRGRHRSRPRYVWLASVVPQTACHMARTPRPCKRDTRRVCWFGVRRIAAATQTWISALPMSTVLSAPWGQWSRGSIPYWYIHNVTSCLSKTWLSDKKRNPNMLPGCAFLPIFSLIKFSFKI